VAYQPDLLPVPFELLFEARVPREEVGLLGLDGGDSRR
jgi:hypothetical protein